MMPERAVQARPRVVGDEVQGNGRLAVGLADEAEHAGQRQVVHVVGRIVAVGAVLTEAGERAVDDARVEGADGLVVGAQPLHDARPEALHDDVGVRGQLPEDRLALGGLHVEGHAALVAVDEGEGGPPLRLGVAGLAVAGRLDLEDVGAHVGEHHAGHLRRRHAGHFEDLDPVEHSHGDLLLGPAFLRGAPSARGCRDVLEAGDLLGDRLGLVGGQDTGARRPGTCARSAASDSGCPGCPWAPRGAVASVRPSRQAQGHAGPGVLLAVGGQPGVDDHETRAISFAHRRGSASLAVGNEPRVDAGRRRARPPRRTPSRTCAPAR